jgi:hypothetical protein
VPVEPTDRQVADLNSLRQALQTARPATRIRLAPGDYTGSLQAENLHGTAQQPIVIEAQDPQNPPRLNGGTLQLSRCSYLTLDGLVFARQEGVALKIDDANQPDSPSHHVTLSNLLFQDTGHNGTPGIAVRLMGVNDLAIEAADSALDPWRWTWWGATAAWSGSAISRTCPSPWATPCRCTAVRAASSCGNARFATAAGERSTSAATRMRAPFDLRARLARRKTSRSRAALQGAGDCRGHGGRGSVPSVQHRRAAHAYVLGILQESRKASSAPV